MGPTSKKRLARLPIFWRCISAPSARPRAGENYTGRLGRTLANQIVGVTSNSYQILWAYQLFGMASVGCKPNTPLVPFSGTSLFAIFLSSETVDLQPTGSSSVLSLMFLYLVPLPLSGIELSLPDVSLGFCGAGSVRSRDIVSRQYWAFQFQ
jgi:hypothetical protein